MKDTLFEFVSAVRAAIAEGFIHIFFVDDCGVLSSPTLFGKKYSISNVAHSMASSPEGNLYRISTSDGNKGMLFVFHEDDIEAQMARWM